MVWVEMPFGGHTDLHVYNGGTLTGVTYQVAILDPYVRLNALAVGHDFIPMRDLTQLFLLGTILKVTVWIEWNDQLNLQT